MLKQIKSKQILKKVLISLLLAIFSLPGSAEAVLVSVLKQQNAEVVMERQVGKLSYNDAEPGWRLKTAAQFKVTADPSTTVIVTAPATISLNFSGKTGTATMVTRCKTGSYPLSKTDGVPCSAVSTGADGFLWIASFVESVVINQDASAAYVGSLPVTVTY